MRRITGAIVASGVLAVSLAPHFYSAIPIPFDNYKDTSQSAIGYVMLAAKNADRSYTMHFANPWNEGIAFVLLSKLKLINPCGNMPLHLPHTLPKPLLVVVGNAAPHALLWKYPDVSTPGIYNAAPDNENRKLELRSVFCNNDAVELLNKVYTLSDPGSWTRIPMTEQDLTAPTGPSWMVFPRDMQRHFKIGCGNDRIIAYPRPKACTVASQKKFFFFTEDKICFSGKAHRTIPVSISVTAMEKAIEGKRILFRPLKTIRKDVVWTYADNGEKQFSLEFDISAYDFDKLDLYYQVGIIFPPQSEGELYDLQLRQLVSGKLKLRNVLSSFTTIKR